MFVNFVCKFFPYDQNGSKYPDTTASTVPTVPTCILLSAALVENRHSIANLAIP